MLLNNRVLINKVIILIRDVNLLVLIRRINDSSECFHVIFFLFRHLFVRSFFVYFHGDRSRCAFVKQAKTFEANK